MATAHATTEILAAVSAKFDANSDWTM